LSFRDLSEEQKQLLPLCCDLMFNKKVMIFFVSQKPMLVK